MQTLFTTNFEIQYDEGELGEVNELQAVQRRAVAFQNGCEGDYAQLCDWFGIAIGAGLGPNVEDAPTPGMPLRRACVPEIAGEQP